MPIPDREQRPGSMHRQIQRAARAEIAIIHIAAKDIGRPTRYASHAWRRGETDDPPKGFEGYHNARGIRDGPMLEIEPEHPVPRIGELLRQQPTIGDKTLARNGQPQVDGPDPNL